MRDPYEVLGIQRGASEDEIKKAYRSQCKRWHPDLNPNDPTAEEKFKEIQAAYDAITKGEVNSQSAGYGSYGGYNAYRQNPYNSYQGGYRQTYQQQGTGNPFEGFDGFDPFGFGFDFGGYQQQSQRGPSYSSAESTEMQAARNFIVNGRYAEARNLLDTLGFRNARWYYLSSLANKGLGRTVDALQDARRAVEMEPDNTEYRLNLNQMQNTGRTYRTYTTTPSGGLGGWCWRMLLLNLLCNCCCGGWRCGPYFGPRG